MGNSVINFDQPWSNDPNAPQIPYELYVIEKAYFAGCLLGAMFYGTHNYAAVYPCSSGLFNLSYF